MRQEQTLTGDLGLLSLEDLRWHPASCDSLGGGVYISLKDRDDITPIQTKLMDFIEKRI